MNEKKFDIINSIVVKEIRHKLNGFTSKGLNNTDIKSDLNILWGRINVDDIYSQTESRVSSIITKRDYKESLKIFNNKGLCQQVSGVIGLKKKYPQVVLDLLKGEKRSEIIKALQEYLPNID